MALLIRIRFKPFIIFSLFFGKLNTQGIARHRINCTCIGKSQGTYTQGHIHRPATVWWPEGLLTMTDGRRTELVMIYVQRIRCQKNTSSADRCLFVIEVFNCATYRTADGSEVSSLPMLGYRTHRPGSDYLWLRHNCNRCHWRLSSSRLEMHEVFQ